MKITSVTACTCVVPLDSGIAIAKRAVSERHYMLVRVGMDCGIDGLGYCYVGHKAGSLATVAVTDLIRGILVGRELTDMDSIWESMYGESLLHGRRGSVLRAISAIDMALWDAVAKDADSPLYKYIGGIDRDMVPAYASGGYYADGKTADDLANEMSGYVHMGFNAVKMKVGRVSPEEDELRIRAVREAIGYDVKLFLDVNNGWPDIGTSVRAIEMFEKYQPGWIEEPLMPDEIKGHAEISRRVRTPIATGEIHATHWEFQQIIDLGAASILQADAGVCGGVTEWRKIAHIAELSELSMAPHWLADVHLHLVAATSNATWVEYFTNHDVLNVGRLFTTGLDVVPGGLKLPRTPGLGFEFDERAVGHYSADGWV